MIPGKGLIQKIISIYKSEGLIELLKRIISFLSMKLSDFYRQWIVYSVGPYYYYLKNRSWRYEFLNPFEIYWIDPQEVTYVTVPPFWADEYNKAGVWIKKGDWDRRVKHKRLTYPRRHERFKGERFLIPYEIQYFEFFHLCNQIYQGRNVDTDLVSSEHFMRIVDDIQHNGYKNPSESPHQALRQQLHHENFHAVLVSVTRDGEFALEDGKHRLSAAKILNLDKIPVRILVYHNDFLKK